jgi:hypothetical protein
MVLATHVRRLATSRLTQGADRRLLLFSDPALFVSAHNPTPRLSCTWFARSATLRAFQNMPPPVQAHPGRRRTQFAVVLPVISWCAQDAVPRVEPLEPVLPLVSQAVALHVTAVPMKTHAPPLRRMVSRMILQPVAESWLTAALAVVRPFGPEVLDRQVVDGDVPRPTGEGVAVHMVPIEGRSRSADEGVPRRGDPLPELVLAQVGHTGTQPEGRALPAAVDHAVQVAPWPDGDRLPRLDCRLLRSREPQICAAWWPTADAQCVVRRGMAVACASATGESQTGDEQGSGPERHQKIRGATSGGWRSHEHLPSRHRRGSVPVVDRSPRSVNGIAGSPKSTVASIPPGQ